MNPALMGSLAEVQLTGSSIDTSSVASINLLVEAYKLLKHKDLESIAFDERLMATLLDKSTRLGATWSQLPSNFKEAVSKLQRFSKDLDKEPLLARQAQIIIKLSPSQSPSFTKTWKTLRRRDPTQSIQQPRLRLVLLKEQLKELAEKKSKLLKYEKKIDTATGALKEKLKEKLSEGQKINEELPKVELMAKKAEETHQFMSDQLKDVKQSHKIAKA